MNGSGRSSSIWHCKILNEKVLEISQFVKWGEDHSLNLIIIPVSFLACILIFFIFIITISRIWIKSFSISSNLCSDGVIRSAPDVTRNSNWPIWRSFYCFLGRLLENPAALHVKSFMKSRKWMDMLWWNFNN